METLIYHPSDELYGADRVALILAQILADHGHAVTLAVPLDVKYPAHALCGTAAELPSPITVLHEDWPVLRREYLRNGRKDLLRRTARLLWARTQRDKPRPNLVISNTSASLLAANLQGVARGGARLFYLHESLSKTDRLLLRILLARTDLVVAVSEAAATTLPARLRARTTVIHNGFPDMESDEVHSPQGPVTFLLASRWNAWKGHRLFLDAWKNANTSNKKLIVLGDTPPSGGSFDVREYVHQYEISNVEIVGEVSDVLPYLGNADLVVVPSQAADPLPTIAIEALRAGRPVAASAAGGLTDIVSDGCGWLMPIGDTDAWVKLIEMTTRAECAARTNAAREKFKDAFSADRYRQQVLALLGDIQ